MHANPAMGPSAAFRAAIFALLATLYGTTLPGCDITRRTIEPRSPPAASAEERAFLAAEPMAQGGERSTSLWEAASPVGPGLAEAEATAPRYVLPVDAPVIDFFRPPAGPYGPGNRGWEFATVGGESVRAVGAGVVAFAGPVAGRGVVSIEHPDGLRSSLTGMARIDVTAGDLVAAGVPVGTARAGLHLGFRRGGQYIDPADVFRLEVHARLVPVP